jgi:hypothetical protein
MGLTKPRAAQIYNLDYKQSTRVVTVANVTLSGGAPATVDGVTLSLNDRILVTAQSTASQNGLYYVTTVGTGSNGTWARTSDGNETGEIEAGMIVMVTEGTIYADTQWKLTTDDPITIDTTSLTFVQNYSANSISSGTSNVVVTSNANVTISSAGTANVLTISSTGTVVTGTESVTGNITGGNVLTNGLISATGNITGNYFLGNVFYANGITASKIYSGTSEVNVVSSGGNVNVSIGGTSNVVVFASTGEYVTGVVSATGNITGNYFLGNVFYANGITASKIYNGTSEANVGTSGGNANISIGGTSNVVVFASTGEYVTGLLSVTGNITGGNIAAGTANISTFIGNVFFGSVPAQPTYYTIAPLNLNNSLAAATKVQLNLINTGGGAGAGSAIDFYTYQISVAAANAESRIAAIDDGNYSAYLSLQTKTPGNTGTNGLVERVKIDSTGASVVANITGGNILTGGRVSATGNVTGGNILGNGAGLSGINVFSNVSVFNGNSIVANTISDTLTLIGGTGITITANAAADSITFTTTSTTSIFATGGSMGLVTEAVTASENLGLVTDPVTVSYNLGTIAVNGVVTNDNIADYTITGTKLANNFVYGSDFTVTGNVTGGNLISTGNIFVANVQVLNQDQTLAYIFAF